MGAKKCLRHMSLRDDPTGDLYKLASRLNIMEKSGEREVLPSIEIFDKKVRVIGSNSMCVFGRWPFRFVRQAYRSVSIYTDPSFACSGD